MKCVQVLLVLSAVLAITQAATFNIEAAPSEDCSEGADCPLKCTVEIRNKDNIVKELGDVAFIQILGNNKKCLDCGPCSSNGMSCSLSKMGSRFDTVCDNMAK